MAKPFNLSRLAVLSLCACAPVTGILCSCQKTQYSALIGFEVKAVQETKGQPVTTTNIGTLNGYEEFVCDVYIGDTEAGIPENVPRHYIDKGRVKYYADAPGGYNWNFADENGNILDKFWPNDVYLSFWSWAPSTLPDGGELVIETRPTSNSENGRLNFEYTLPEPGANGDDALRQKDIIFAYNWQKLRDGDADGRVDIHFYHALSRIVFLIKEDPAYFDPALDIVDISLLDLPSSGSCTFIPQGTILQRHFDWALGSSRKDYRQLITKSEFAVSPNISEEKGKTSPPEKSFMVLPGSNNDGNVSVAVTFRRADGSTTVRVAQIAAHTWHSGDYYTYRINATSLDEPVGFDVTLVDWIDGGVGNI